MFWFTMRYTGIWTLAHKTNELSASSIGWPKDRLNIADTIVVSNQGGVMLYILNLLGVCKYKIHNMTVGKVNAVVTRYVCLEILL